jgi:hypothetical protein
MGGILDRMLKRVLPVLLALAVAGAPVVFEACHATCASTMAGRGPSGATGDGHQPCHDDTAPRGPQLSHAPHACDHGGDLPSAPTLSAARDTSAASLLGLIVTSPTIVAPLQTPSFWTALAARSLEPAGLRLAAPLRI